MNNQGELRFAGLCGGGRLAHYLSPGAVTGAHPRLEHFATRESTWRRFRNRSLQGLSVREERRALQAFYGHMLPAGRQPSDGRDILEVLAEEQAGGA